jgi:hypothetical protein
LSVDALPEVGGTLSTPRSKFALNFCSNTKKHKDKSMEFENNDTQEVVRILEEFK